MKDTLIAGLEAKRRFTIDAGRCIGFMGDAGRVYATPELVRDVEHDCRDLALPHLDEGEDTVGIRVALDHLAATPFGMAVEITVRLAAIEGQVLTFEVLAFDTLDQICRGTHKRFVVDTARTHQRLAQKIARAATATVEV